VNGAGYRPRRALSIGTSFNYDLTLAEQFPLIAAAGFTHVSLGGREEHAGYLSRAGRDRIKALLRTHALALDTVHGPRADHPEASTLLAATVEAAADLGALVVVAHGGPFDFPAAELPKRLDRLLRTCEALSPVLERTGVALALENVLPGPATDLVRQALPRLDARHVGFCYDSAHDQIGGPRPFDLLIELRGRLRAVHLSDRVREHVDHVPPGEGFIDWPALCRGLRAAPFAGPVLLEVAVEHAAEREPRRFLARAYAAGCQLHDQIYG
jgi:sugar phosphate isomerase/epimerase